MRWRNVDGKQDMLTFELDGKGQEVRGVANKLSAAWWLLELEAREARAATRARLGESDRSSRGDGGRARSDWRAQPIRRTSSTTAQPD